MLEKLFKLKENNTNVKTEVLAGITTFMTMAYILAVNPSILSITGMNQYGVLFATAISAAIGSFLMAFLANYPFALAPAMGLNATFTYTVVIDMGISWQVALFAVFVEGIIFIVLSLTRVREAIFNAIPLSLKHAISAGIGLFIAFIGLQDAGVIVKNESVLVSLVNFKEDFFNTGITALLAIVGIVIIGVLLIKKVRGGIILGMFITWVIGIILELTSIYTPVKSCIPHFDGFHFSEISEVFGQCFDIGSFVSNTNIVNFIVVVFTFLFIDMFDTLGTLIGVSTKANMLDKDNKLPRIKGALLADSIATCSGAILGTSTVSTYVESASGVSEGGRTGLTSCVTGILFLLAILLSPLFISIPFFATAPAMIIVGVYMIGGITNIDFDNFADGIPAFLTIIMMPLTYSVAEGIFFGVISYVFIHIISGKTKEISKLMYVLAILFILKYVFI